MFTPYNHESALSVVCSVQVSESKSFFAKLRSSDSSLRVHKHDVSINTCLQKLNWQEWTQHYQNNLDRELFGSYSGHSMCWSHLRILCENPVMHHMQFRSETPQAASTTMVDAETIYTHRPLGNSLWKVSAWPLCDLRMKQCTQGLTEGRELESKTGQHWNRCVSFTCACVHKNNCWHHHTGISIVRRIILSEYNVRVLGNFCSCLQDKMAKGPGSGLCADIDWCGRFGDHEAWTVLHVDSHSWVTRSWCDSMTTRWLTAWWLEMYCATHVHCVNVTGVPFVTGSAWRNFKEKPFKFIRVVMWKMSETTEYPGK